MQQLLKILFSEGALSEEQSYEAMSFIMSGKALPAQLGAFLGFLRGKGESVAELTGFARCMRDHALKPEVKRDDLVDNCGTGGDGTGTFNISTAVSFVLAGAGLGVAKHGNRSVSSKSGSADVLEALGCDPDLPIETVGRQIDSIGFGFLFARKVHPAMRYVAPLRGWLGVRTVFNILGPLTNPLAPRRQLIGVYDRTMLTKLAHVLAALGTEEAMLVASADGLDEISLSAETFVAHLKNGKVKESVITPEDAGLARAPLAALQGGEAKTNAAIIQDVLGKVKSPRRDVVLLNAAACLMLCGKASSLREGAEFAGEIIDTGKAAAIIDKLRNFI